MGEKLASREYFLTFFFIKLHNGSKSVYAMSVYVYPKGPLLLLISSKVAVCKHFGKAATQA